MGMPEEITTTTETPEVAPTTPEIPEEIMKRIERLEAGNAALKAEKDKLIDQVKSHGAEMKAKKERERTALEQAGQYQEALAMLMEEQKTYQQQADEFAQQRSSWEQQRRRFAVMSELQKPGVINPTIPAEDVLRFIDFSTIELDEDSKVANWQTHYTSLISGRDYLRPTGVGKAAQPIGRPGAGTPESTSASRDAQLISKHSGLPLESCQTLAQDKNFLEMAKRNGWLRDIPDVSRYSPTLNA